MSSSTRLHASRFDLLLYHVRSILSFFLPLLMTMYLHKKHRTVVALAHLCISSCSPSSPFLTLHHPRHLAMDQKPASWRLAQTTIEGWKLPSMRVHRGELLCEIWRSGCSIAWIQNSVLHYTRSNLHPDAPCIPRVAVNPPRSRQTL